MWASRAFGQRDPGHMSSMEWPGGAPPKMLPNQYPFPLGENCNLLVSVPHSASSVAGGIEVATDPESAAERCIPVLVEGVSEPTIDMDSKPL